MSLSDKTKTQIERVAVKNEDGLYPDREATPNSSGGYDIKNPNATVLRLTDEVPTTTRDFSNMMKWEHGDTLYGDIVDKDKFMKEYRKDINKAWGRDSDNMIFIDTFKEIGPQLNKFKSRRNKKRRR